MSYKNPVQERAKTPGTGKGTKFKWFKVEIAIQ